MTSINLVSSFSGSAMTSGHNEQYFNTQKNKFEKLYDGVHHHKTFEFGYSFSHLLFIIIIDKSF